MYHTHTPLSLTLRQARAKLCYMILCHPSSSSMTLIPTAGKDCWRHEYKYNPHSVDESWRGIPSCILGSDGFLGGSETFMVLGFGCQDGPNSALYYHSMTLFVPMANCPWLLNNQPTTRYNTWGSWLSFSLVAPVSTSSSCMYSVR